jgi:hypothetical protein
MHCYYIQSLQYTVVPPTVQLFYTFKDFIIGQVELFILRKLIWNF